MRWYKIVTPNQTWDATADPYALNIQIDIPVSSQNTPNSGAFVRLWGISLQTLLNAKSFNKQSISIYGGMQQGLPLANPAEQGLLAQGSIFPALGNWVGTDMTLDFYLKAPLGTTSETGQANVIHSWQKGQPLSTAIKQTLTTAFPKFSLNINISPNLVLGYTDTGFYQTMGQYAAYINSISKSVMNSPSYHGVNIATQGSTINVDDGTQAPANTQISYTDLVGQPIWTGPNTIQFKTVLRGDIPLFKEVTLPQTLATLTDSSGTNVGGSASNLIQGKFKITRMRHTGNFRQPDWASWCTTFDAIQSS